MSSIEGGGRGGGKNIFFCEYLAGPDNLPPSAELKLSSWSGLVKMLN